MTINVGEVTTRTGKLGQDHNHIKSAIANNKESSIAINHNDIRLSPGTNLLPEHIHYCRLDHLLTGKGHGTDKAGDIDQWKEEQRRMAKRTNMDNEETNIVAGSTSIILDEYKNTNSFTNFAVSKSTNYN